MCKINIATDHDLDGINKIIIASYNTTSVYKPPALLKLLDIQQNKNQVTFIARDNERIIGFLVVKNKTSFQSADEAELEILCVHPASQGKHIGECLLKQTIQHVRDKTKLKRLTLKVLNENLRAIMLFEKVGFVTDYIDTISKKGRWMHMYIQRDNYSLR